MDKIEDAATAAAGSTPADPLSNPFSLQGTSTPSAGSS